jgi:type IV secretory pathway ATPase VirB11/archaellum biosynthesis ATPase
VGDFIKIKYKEKPYRTNILFKDSEELNNFLKKLANKTNQKINEDSPLLDTTYKGYKIHAILGLDLASSKFTISKLQ